MVRVMVCGRLWLARAYVQFVDSKVLYQERSTPCQSDYAVGVVLPAFD